MFHALVLLIGYQMYKILYFVALRLPVNNKNKKYLKILYPCFHGTFKDFKERYPPNFLKFHHKKIPTLVRISNQF